VDPSEAAIAYGRRHALPTITFTIGTAQDLDLPDATFDVVTCTLAVRHIPARQRQAAFREMYRVTKPGGRVLAADFNPSRRPLPLHPGGRRMCRAAATVGPLEELAATAGYRFHRPAAPAALRIGHPPRTRSKAITSCGHKQAPSPHNFLSGPNTPRHRTPRPPPSR
jgi:SAM-dependent methyltransferase